MAAVRRAYLTDHGGLEEAVRQTYELMDPVSTQKNQQAGLRAASQRMASLVQSKSPPPPFILKIGCGLGVVPLSAVG